MRQRAVRRGSGPTQWSTTTSSCRCTALACSRTQRAFAGSSGTGYQFVRKRTARRRGIASGVFGRRGGDMAVAVKLEGGQLLARPAGAQGVAEHLPEGVQGQSDGERGKEAGPQMSRPAGPAEVAPNPPEAHEGN